MFRFYTVAPSGLCYRALRFPKVTFHAYGMVGYPGLYTVAPSGLFNAKFIDTQSVSPSCFPQVGI